MEKVTYEQISKNTVKAKNQLEESAYVSFENPQGWGLRVLFVGNSITRHGIAHDIGWHNDWGMAASSKDKDYVHKLIARINTVMEDTAYCICQVAAWERGYKEGTEKFHQAYKSAHDFGADVVILRFIENCPFDGWDANVFKAELEKLLGYLNSSGKAKVVITTGFWYHCGDDAIREFAGEHGIALVELGDLGELDEMKAVSLFEHAGVANHPGDLGMEKIAERIFERLGNVSRSFVFSEG